MKRLALTIVIMIGSLLPALLLFQNCSEVQYSSVSPSDSSVTPNGDTSPNDNSDTGKQGEDRGVLGGHFDLDTATDVYNSGDGTTNHHEHEYDDKHNTNIADFFALQNAKFDQIQDTIDNAESFYIIVANAELSPMANLVLNNSSVTVTDHQYSPSKTVYSLSGAPGTTKLTQLQAVIDPDAILDNGLVATQTNCVRANDYTQDGRYRNGALVIQAIRADKIADLDTITGTASSSEALLWEATIFWHDKDAGCL